MELFALKTKPLIQTGQGSYTKRTYPSRRTWTKEEDKIIRESYPNGGPQAAQEALKKAGFDSRKRSCIYARASMLCVTQQKKEPYEEKVVEQSTDALIHSLRGFQVAIEETAGDLQKLIERFRTVAKTIEERMSKNVQAGQ
jgi:hypothetical protein